MRRHVQLAAGTAILVAALLSPVTGLCQGKLTIKTTSVASGTVNVSYSQTLSATGGKSPYTWSISNGALPTGLTIDGQGVISGTPTAPGKASFTAKVADTNQNTDTANLQITIASNPVITTATLPDGEPGVSYSATLAQTGAVSPVTWTVSQGILPVGLHLTGSTGAITGTPLLAGTANLTVQLSDSGGGTATKALSLTIDPPPAVTTTSLPAGAVGTPYSQALNATGGSPPYTWSVSLGSLPAGIGLAGNTISGTPTAAGSSVFTVKVTDSASVSATGILSLTINSAALSITTTSLPAGTVGTAYSQALNAAGGSPPYTWALATGTLPAGLNLAGNTISGTPTTAGPSSFTIKVTDSASASATAALSLAINSAGLSVTTTSLPGGSVGTAYSQALNAAGGSPPYTWALASGTLPAGLNLAGNTISGTPTTAGPSNFTIKVTDSASASATAALSLAISAQNLSITTSSLPAGTVGTSYSQALNAAGGSPPYTWSVTSGTLPAGLSLAGNTISGTPTAAGSSNLTLKVTDSASTSATAPLTLKINAPALSITTSSLPAGTMGAAYSQALSATGGTSPYTWSVASGTLPAGLSLSTGGTISGTPTSAGSSTFSVKVSDSASASATASLSLTVNAPALSVTTSSLPAGMVGAPYSQTLNATGGTSPYTWSVASGSLPAGLTLSAGGTISGTPTTAGPASFTVKVSDSASASATASLSLTINAPVLSITTSSLPAGTVGAPYSQTLGASGGSSPYTWSVASGSLPAGLTLSASGTISGTPTAAGSASFSVKVSDSASASATAALSLTINAPAVSVTTSSLPAGMVGASYSQALGAAGGTPPYTWSVASGALPPGLNLSAGGTISGLPTVAGPASFTVKVSDSASASATAALSMMINAPALGITTSSLPAGTVGTSYSQVLAATGGTPPYNWTVTSGALPVGLGLGPGGTLSGTPTAAGSASFTVKVTDSSSATATAALSLTINAPALSITTSSLPAGTAGTAYSQGLTATGGTPPYTWSVTSGALPPGLELAGATISGTPAVTGSSSFTVKVTDSSSASATAALSLSINSPVLNITTSSLPAGTIGTAYSQGLNATGGTPPYTWSVASGSLPAGLSLAGGTISGTPTATGPSSFTIKVSDSASASATAVLSLAVSAPVLNITTSSLPAGTIGTPYSQALSAAGGTPPYTWSVASGSLPAGLSLAGGTITGTPTAIVTTSFTVRVTDSTSLSSTMALSLAINSQVLMITTSSLPAGTIGQGYSQGLLATGGSPPYTWTVTSGSLPAGLSLAGGTISGTPTATGSSNFTVRVTDSASVSALAALSLAINSQVLTITTSSLPAGAVGEAYSQTLNVTGGTSPYTWSISAGTLPTGLRITTTGTIRGTPGSLGIAAFTAQVTDNAGVQTTKALSIQVLGSSLQLTTSSLPQSTVGANYSATLTASGGTPPYRWSVGSGSLPPGLTLDPSGTLGGTSSTAGSYTFTLTVTDSSGASVGSNVTVTINGPVSLTTSSLTDALVQAPYSQTLQAAGGTPPYTWLLTAGALPDGITLDPTNGTLSGTPSAVGTFRFTLRAIDSVFAFAESQFQITVAAGLIITSAPTLPPGSVALQYDQTLNAAGGTPPYIWSISSGGLPAGLTLNPQTGELAGIPSAADSFQFTVVVTDGLARAATKQFSLTVAAPLVISSAPQLAPAVAGTSYSQSLAASGGTPPYLWSITSGQLPPGLSFDLASVTISGVPTLSGSFSFEVQVVDKNSVTTSKQFSISVTSNLVITTTSPLPDALAGSPYTAALTVTGGVPPYVWTVAAGSLPPGLTIDPNSNSIVGTPSAGGTFGFTLQVSDASGGSATNDYTLNATLPAAPSVSIVGLPDPANPADQPTFTVSLSGPYPLQATGQIVMTFTPDAVFPIDDASIQFATGGRTVNFTIPAGATTAVFSTPQIGLQTGTVAGVITLNLTLQSAGGQAIGTATSTLHVNRSAPVMRNTTLVQTAGGFEVHITGYSTPRQLTNAVVQFTPSAGSNLQTTQLTISLSDLSANWYQSSASNLFGSQFTLILPFTVQGSASGIASVSVSLANATGSSQPATLKFQ